MALNFFRRHTCQYVLIVFLSWIATSERHLEGDVLGVDVTPDDGQDGDMAHDGTCQGCKEGDMVVIDEDKWTQQERTAWYNQIKQNQSQEVKFGRQPDLSLSETEIMPEKLEFRPWPDATIKYCYDQNIEPEARQVLMEGMAEWAARTCIKFELSCPDSKLGIVTFKSNEDGCWAHAGYYRNYEMKLNLGPGCRQKGTAIHELGHTIGFHHEHSRPDRDDYVTILWGNIKEDKEDQFYKKSQALTGGYQYDLASIMHYRKTAFSKDGKPTIEMKSDRDSWNNCDFGQRHFLSRGDILSANAGYGCDKRSDRSDKYFCVDLVDNCKDYETYCPRSDLRSEDDLKEFGEMFQINVRMPLKMLALCRSTCGICTCEDTDEAECRNQMGSLEGSLLCEPSENNEKQHVFLHLAEHCRRSCGFCTGQGAEVCKANSGERSIMPYARNIPQVRLSCPQVGQQQNNYLCSHSFVRRTCPLQCGRCPTAPYCPTNADTGHQNFQRQKPRRWQDLDNRTS